MAICDGRSYDHENKRWNVTECKDSVHGTIIYARDLERFFNGQGAWD